MATDIFAAGRIVGQVEGNTFKKTVDSKKHFLRFPPAIAFDLASLKQAEEAGARIVQVLDQREHMLYTATLNQIYQHGFEVDRGHGQQFALNLPLWQAQKTN